MKEMYQVTFTQNGYVAGVWNNQSESEEEAIESAKLYQQNEYDHVYAEPVSQLDSSSCKA